MTGRRVALSLPRRWIADLMALSAGMPMVTFERRMSLGTIAAARTACRPAPAWVLLFVKAYSIVAARRPELRRAYVGFPWPHLYEADESVASVSVEREFAGEPAVFFAQLRSPDRRPLADMTPFLAEWKSAPLDGVKPFRRLVRHTRLPFVVRRLMWRRAMLTGRMRAKTFGTFAASVTGGAGAAAVNLISPLATSLSYGPVGGDGSALVRLHFDHRVLDGMAAARALAELEAVLTGEILNELNRMSSALPA